MRTRPQYKTCLNSPSFNFSKDNAFHAPYENDTGLFIQLLDFFKNSPLSFIIYRNNRVYAFNDAFLKLSGYEANELYNLNRAALGIKIINKTNGDLANEKPLYGYLKNKSGSLICCDRIQSKIIIDESGAFYKLDLLMRHKAIPLKFTTLTMQRIEDIANYANKVAHDLKCPLRAAAQLVEWINTEVEKQDYDHALKHLNDLSDRLLRMKDLVEQLLDNALSESKVKEFIDTKKLLEEVSQVLQLESQNVRLLYRGHFPIVMINKTELYQVFQNLLANAVKYNQRSEKVIILSASEDGQFYYIKFADNGIGVDEEHLEKIFEPFVSINPDKSSTGLGLSISREIMRSYGGDLVIDSTENKGSTISLSLSKMFDHKEK